jgi:MraZ protein
VFLSRFKHALDDKGRVILPAKWRSALEGGAVVSEWPRGCLAIFPVDGFLAVAEKVQSMATVGDDESSMTLSFFSGASDVVPDKQGRISIPEHLRDYAGLTGEIWLAGHFDHIEVWNPDLFDEKKGEGTAKLHSTAGIAVLRGSE